MSYRTLWEIDEDIMRCFDPETGEIDEERWDALNMERDKKVEGILLLFKNKVSFANEVKGERDTLDQRYETLSNEIDRMRDWINNVVLRGEPFETSRVKASYRKSTSVEVDESLIPDKFCQFQITRKPIKSDIKDALQKGEEIPGARLVKKRNLQLK